MSVASISAPFLHTRSHQCSGTCVLYKIPVVVMGEHANFVGGEDLLKSKGIEVVNLEDPEITKMFSDWMESDVGKRIWNEDIGEVSV